MFVAVVLGLLLCGCSGIKTKADARAKTGENENIQTRNNAASLLADLLNDEENVDKVLIVKDAGKDVTGLVKLIAATAATHAKELAQLTNSDSTLRLDVMDLPPGEQAARNATAKAKEHELLLTTGTNFEFNLLYSQAEAENYGWQLAVVAAKNSAMPNEKEVFSKIAETMHRLYDNTVEQIRSLPSPGRQ